MDEMNEKANRGETPGRKARGLKRATAMPAQPPTISISYLLKGERNDGTQTSEKTPEKKPEDDWPQRPVPVPVAGYKVSTTEDIKELSISPDAAVVLVMDVSNSMSDPAGDGSRRNRMEAAKDGAQHFLQTFGDVDGETRRMLSIVEFGSHAKRVMEWTDVADTNGYSYAYSRIESLQYKGSHDGTGGTNIEGGLQLAYNQLDDPAVSGIGSLFVIMLTDGQPTFHIHSWADRSNDTFIQGAQGGGNYTTPADYLPVYDVARNIISKAQLFTIAYGSGNQTVYTKEGTTTCTEIGWHQHRGLSGGTTGYVNGYGQFVECPGRWNCDNYYYFFWEKIHLCEGGWFNGRHDYEEDHVVTVSEWLGEFSIVKTTTDLDQVFEDIASQIEKLTEAWTVTDPMGQYAKFSRFATQKPDHILSYDEGTSTITWNLRQDEFESSGSGSKKTYTYEFSYYVTLNNLETQPEVDYPLNRNTTLEYAVTTKTTVGGQETSTIKFGTANFLIPTAHGYAGNLTINKSALHDEDIVFGYQEEGSDELRNVAKFTLSHNCGAVCPCGTWTDSHDTANSTLTFANIPSGHTYKLTEEVPEGYDQSLAQEYTVVVSKVGNTDKVSVTVYDESGKPVDNDNTLNVVNTLDAGSVTVIKNWDDQNDAAGMRPKEIEVTLTNKNDPDALPRTVTLDSSDAVSGNSDQWKATFENVPAIDVETGEKIIYTATEEAINGYTPTYNSYDSETSTLTLTNSLENETSVTVTKEWLVPDGFVKRPIEVQLKQNGVSFGEPVTLSEENEWTCTWNNLPVYTNGVKNTYTVEEITEVANTDSVVSGDGNTFTITNAIEQVSPLSINGYKKWNDANDASSARPDLKDVVVTLTGTVDGETVVTDTTNLDDEGYFTFTDLPKYDIQDNAGTGYTGSGKEIQYTVSDSVDGYLGAEAEVEFDESTNIATVILTNTIDTDNTAELTIEKVWEDGEDYDETRPDQVTIQVWRDVPGLDSYEPFLFDEIEFSASEYDVTESQTVTQEDGTETTEEVVVGTRTTWDDAALEDTITVPMYYTADDGTVYAYLYYVVEVNADGDALIGENNELTGQNGAVYVATYGDNSVIPAQSGDSTLKVTNTLSSEESDRMTIEVSKTWVDPYTDAERAELGIKAIITLSGSDSLEYVSEPFTANGTQSIEVPKYDENGAITYTATETVELGASGVQYTSEQDGYHFTNTIQQENLSITVQKVWEDNFSTDTSKRPSIELVLCQDGEETSFSVSGSEMTTTDQQTYTHTFTNVPRYDLTDGHEYVYSLVEKMSNLKDYSYIVNVDTGADTNSDGIKDCYTVTNIYDPGVAYISGTKTWYAPAGTDLPDSVQIEIYRSVNGGEPVFVETKEISGTGDLWSYSFQFEKFDESGNLYTYTIQEQVPDGYTVEQDGYDLINTHEEYGKTASFSVTKYWYGPEEARPEDGLTVSLYRSTVENDPAPEFVQGILLTAPTAEGSDPDVWTGSFGAWPLYNDNHERYYYSIKESGEYNGVYTYDGVNYEVQYDQDRFTITNTNAAEQEYIDVTVNKEWDRLDEATEDVRVYLYANGGLVAIDGVENPVTLTAENGYTYTWTHLPKYLDDMSGTVIGGEITYSVQEAGAVYSGKVDGEDAYTIQIGDDHYQVTYGTAEDGSLVISNKLMYTDFYRYRVAVNYLTKDENGNITSTETVYLDENGTLIDTPSDLYGQAGQTVTVTLNDYVSFDGNTYTYVSGWLDGTDQTTDFTFTLDRAQHIYTVDLTYERTAETSTDPDEPGGGGRGDRTVTVYYREEGTRDQLADTEQREYDYGDAWDVTDLTDLAIDGYVITRVEGDTSGDRLTSNKTVTVWYSNDETDIEDPDTPTTDLPDGGDTGDTGDTGNTGDPGDTGDETDIGDDDVPLAEAPETGDASLLWVILAIASGSGLIWLALTGKKRKECEEQ